MPLKTTPPGEDPVQGTRAIPVSIGAAGTPPGNDGVRAADEGGELENAATVDAHAPQGVGFDDEEEDQGLDFLSLVRECESQALLYLDQANRRAWSDSLRAFHNDHYMGSKYTKPEYRSRSKLFVPKTRGAVRKDNAAVAASLFNSVDAISCLAGNESDPRQRASAAVMTELVNYRTDRTSGKASFPWFLISLGARQDALLTGVCLSKQCWKQQFRKAGSEQVEDVDQATGEPRTYSRDVYTLDVDRPDMVLIPPENYVIDPAADWTDPVQTSAFLILKYPMSLEEIADKQDAPVNPWNHVPQSILNMSSESASAEMAGIRRAREGGLDRLSDSQTGQTFKVVWVYETFMRIGGEDWTFYSIGSRAFLTDPKPVREVYPEQYGDRPVALGYGSLEAHRIYPMAPAESWQPLQNETNDLRNLRLDATKQNVMPISKIRRGRQIDIDQVRRRSHGSSILVQDPDDVTWESAPAIPQNVVEMSRELEVEFDDLAGVQNYGNVQQNNALGKTLGGLKLAAGSANAVQEFDIRVWIETWATTALAQIVRLEQYYEKDAVVLGLCGERAQLFEKHGVSVIDDDLLEQQVTVRISVGLGAGDPQQRLAKFESASAIAGPLLAQTKEFQSGQVEIDWEAIATEVFGAVGYRDGGKRFFRINPQPQQNPMGDLQIKKLMSEIDKNDKTGKASIITALSAAAKVSLGKRALEADVVDMILGHQREAHKMGFEHGNMHNQTHLAAMDHGHRHGLALIGHHRDLANDRRQAEHADRDFAHRQATELAAQQGDEEGGQASAPAPAPAQGGGDEEQALKKLIAGALQSGQLEFTRDPKTNRITGLRKRGG